MSQTDEAVFEVGRNVATTEGSVVFENDLFQLIEYKPLTKTVFERPLLMVPPCINKYYILDLQPENSLIRHAVEQGHRVFVMSWRNADESVAQKTWDDYIDGAAIKAIEVVQEITAAKTINTLGFCVGGTILATALAVLAKRGKKPAASMTLLTTFLDFTNTGVLDLFVDEAMVQMREMTLGPDSPGGGSLLKGQELASTFSALRPNDLVWNYVVGNYLKGETPPAFDLLYWNSDSTNLPGPMYCWYLRNTYLENNLIKPGKVTTCGVPVDLGLHHGADLCVRLARRPHRPVGRCLPQHPGAQGRQVPLRARRLGPHRRRDQPAGQEEAQPLDRRRHLAGHPAGLARQGERDPRQLVARLGRLAQEPCRQAGGGAQGTGKPPIQTHRTRTRPLRQTEGLTGVVRKNTFTRPTQPGEDT